MKHNEIVKLVEKEMLDILENEEKIVLYDVEFIKEAGQYYLRVYIEKKPHVSIADCEKISKALEKILDDKDPIPYSYILEVSSPGLNRILKKQKDFDAHKDQLIDIKLYNAILGKKEWQARLIEMTESELKIEIDGFAHSFEKKNVASVRLSVCI